MNNITELDLRQAIESANHEQLKVMYGWQKYRIDELQRENQNYMDYKNDIDRLVLELNTVIHPQGDGPKSPSLCDLVAYVASDRKKLEHEKAELVAQVEYIKSHLNELIEVAHRCDSWESFPQKPLDRAIAALESLPEQHLNQIKVEAVYEAIDAVRHTANYGEVPLSELVDYAYSLEKGE